jgi:hypothetical protein
MEEIINSFFNGQFTQMTRQIDEYGVYDFASELSDFDGLLEDSQKFRMLQIYLMNKNR